jgi:hypothetical protein
VEVDVPRQVETDLDRGVNRRLDPEPRHGSPPGRSSASSVLDRR